MTMKRCKKFLAALMIAVLCLSAIAALAEGKVTTTTEVNLRKGAGTEYGVIRVVGSGKSLTYDKTAKDDNGVTWYRVTYKGKTGWIISKYTKVAGNTKDASGKITTTGNVNLRKGAGLSYTSITSIPTGVVLSYDKTSKDSRGVTWYRVKYKGKTGWVSSKYAKTGGSGSGGGSSSGKKLITTGSLNMRKGPGLDYKSIRTIDEGVSLTYDKTSKDDRGVTWFRVNYKGKTGWISSKYAKKR